MEEKQVLSQDEVNALLSAVDEGDLDLKPTDGSTPDEETVPSKPYRKHDFTTPGRISRDHYRVMSLLHKLFARTLSSPLSSLLRSLVEVECETIDQLTFGDFVMSLSDPSCLCKLAMNPLPGTVIMEISPELVFPVIEIRNTVLTYLCRKVLFGIGIETLPFLYGLIAHQTDRK